MTRACPEKRNLTRLPRRNTRWLEARAMDNVSEVEYRSILAACRRLPAPRGNYHDNDFVSNLMQTVLDYQLHSDIVIRAYKHFERHHWDRLRTRDQLAAFLRSHPDSRTGNTIAAQELWGYRYWNRLEQLRRLVEYFDSVGVDNQPKLKRWARDSEFEHDFEGRVKGLGFAIYKWLVIRLGIQTVKPDLHVKAFLRSAAGRDFPDLEALAILERAA